jgi:hypothetical protein
MLKFFTGLVVLVATPVLAKEPAAWVLTQKTGDVRVLRNGMQPASLQLRASLAPGDVVATGAGGRAMLTNGNDYVVVAPASRLILPKDQAQTGFTRLVQQLGTMLYKVKHTGVPHFAVETPFLAAVVKGTSFTVVVDQERAAVQVTDGLVEVSAAAGNARRLVEKGATVYIGRARPDAIIEVKGNSAPIATTADTTVVRIQGSGEVPLAAVASLTNGLIAAAPVVTASSLTVPSPTASFPSATANAQVNTGTAASPTVATSAAPTGGSAPIIAATVSTPGATPAATPTITAAISTPTPSAPVITAVGSTPTPSAPAITAAVSTPAIATPTVTATVTTPTVNAPIAIPTVTATVSAPTVTAPTVTAALTAPTSAAPVPTVTATITTPTVTTPTVAIATPVLPPVVVPTVTIPSVTATLGLR